jgi:hypothetical protein
MLGARAAHPESSLADLYDPVTMPPDLVKAHQKLDSVVDAAYYAAHAADARRKHGATTPNASRFCSRSTKNSPRCYRATRRNQGAQKPSAPRTDPCCAAPFARAASAADTNGPAFWRGMKACAVCSPPMSLPYYGLLALTTAQRPLARVFAVSR